MQQQPSNVQQQVLAAAASLPQPQQQQQQGDDGGGTLPRKVSLISSPIHYKTLQRQQEMNNSAASMLSLAGQNSVVNRLLVSAWGGSGGLGGGIGGLGGGLGGGGGGIGGAAGGGRGGGGDDLPLLLLLVAAAASALGANLPVAFLTYQLARTVASGLLIGGWRWPWASSTSSFSSSGSVADLSLGLLRELVTFIFSYVIVQVIARWWSLA